MSFLKLRWPGSQSKFLCAMFPRLCIIYVLLLRVLLLWKYKIAFFLALMVLHLQKYTKYSVKPVVFNPGSANDFKRAAGAKGVRSTGVY